ncbi:transcription factor VIP1-like [Phoenix dactylifera]|uniref:Transcription factor VIP1-like n=1 Tax=Phoenix dactylifera TaxID=42345 RepID=A0A8B7BUR4_PHODC|nr:transcription factor VIP1-like [Phoenix dactylifera]
MDPNRPTDPHRSDPRLGPNPRRSGHRRAHSETILHLPDNLLFDSDPDFSLDDVDFPSLDDDAAIPVPTAAGGPESSVRSAGHHRSVSIDGAFFDGLELRSPSAGGGVLGKVAHHRRSGSVDGSISTFEGEMAGRLDLAKKVMSDDKLAELALIDPKKAKRILANRQSAARSKERRIRYTSELETKVRTLQTEATTLMAQLSQLQRDTTDLTAENRELKLRLQAMEKEAQLRDALNETLRQEIQRLKIAAGEISMVDGNTFNREIQQAASPYISHPQQLPSQTGYQALQFHGSQPSFSVQSGSAQTPQDPMDFM